VRQARIDRGDFGLPEQGQLTNDDGAELGRLRKENRELKREKDFFRLAADRYALGSLCFLTRTPSKNLRTTPVHRFELAIHRISKTARDACE